MRFSLAVAVVVAGISVSGLAQQTFKVKRSAPEKAARKSAPVGKTASPVASNSSSKELQTLERQTAKTSASSRSTGKRTGTGSALKPVRDKSNPPINFGGSGGGKGGGTSNQGSNPYKGRLKQKHARN
jgi:cytoskeletal protein RodZ